MKNFYTSILYSVLFFFSVFCFAQEDKKIVVKIESEFVERQLKLKALVTNNNATYQDLNYLLISIKKTSSGNLSNNKQSGKFSLKPNESKILSEINVNVENNDALKAYLYVRDEETNVLIAKDSLEINKNFFKKNTEKIEKEKSSELTGLAIDETKSKVGKDFFDLFYIQYSQISKKSTSNITISELPTRGTSGQINIQIDDKIIYSFVTSPSEDYLKEQLTTTFRYIADYNANKNLIKNEFKY